MAVSRLLSLHSRYTERLWLSYFLAVGSPLAALLLVWALERSSHIVPVYPIFTVAVILSAVLGGLVPGLVAVGVSLLCIYGALSSRYIPLLGQSLARLSLLVFAVIGVFVSIAVGALSNSQKAFRQSEERLRALVMASSDVLFRMSPDWTEMRQLRSQSSILDSEEPRSDWLARYVYLEDRQQVLSTIEEAIRTKSAFELEHRVLRGDGNVGWAFSRAVPLVEANGDIVEWFGAVTDITERKRAQEALLRGEKLASAGRMAAVIAHELNNPLAAVTNLLFLTKRIQELPESARQYLETAEAELGRMAHITRQSLGFYREAATPALTSVNSILESALDLLKNKVKAKHALIEKQWDGDEQVMAVAGELRQVFANILTNSLDAIADRGKITLRITATQNHVRVTVADNGKGISASSRRHIFEPFYTTKGLSGTGLGLWVSREIIQKHGGVIQMRSKVEHGTVFSVVLRLSSERSVGRSA